VRAFRKNAATPMPWLQGYIGLLRNGPIMKLFEVPGYPTYVSRTSTARSPDGTDPRGRTGSGMLTVRSCLPAGRAGGDGDLEPEAGWPINETATLPVTIRAARREAGPETKP
jgi:hypothetical protein